MGSKVLDLSQGWRALARLVFPQHASDMSERLERELEGQRMSQQAEDPETKTPGVLIVHP